MIPTYMHRLNAWQITAFPERQKSNKWYKNSLLCFLYMCTCKLLVVVKGEAQWACCCTAVCVCAKLGREDQRVWGQTSVMWSLTSSTPDGGREDEGERQSAGEGRREKRFEQILPPTDRAGWPHQSFNTNQSQTCQLHSTCTFPAIPW